MYALYRNSKLLFSILGFFMLFCIYFFQFFSRSEPESAVQNLESIYTEIHSSQINVSKWPWSPFRTQETQIYNALNEPVTLAGISWPGHGLPMIPEGLQYQSIENIVSMVKSLEMNVVRLTYATEMVDDIFERNGHDVGLEESLIKALGGENGTQIYGKIIEHNPGLAGENVTRLDVFDAVAKELERQQLYLHLDNHISKAGWCCGLQDGNGWFEDKYFNTTAWLRGLKHMTAHASTHWQAFISTSLRNEPRDTTTNPTIHATYNWSTWYDNMIPALHAVHNTSPNPLILISGMGYDTSLEPIINNEDLGEGRRFDLRSLDPDLQKKIVWELHNYNNSATSCEALEILLLKAGYHILASSADQPRNQDLESARTQLPAVQNPNVAPIVMTEFGFPQTPDDSGSGSIYAQCLKAHLSALKGGWMYWVLVGSYYEREGIQDLDEGWGILRKDWKGWRSSEVVEQYFRGLIRDTVMVGGQIGW